jgi:membrane fusion protein, multidrug efflux system
MKKLFIFLIFLTFALNACNKEEKGSAELKKKQEELAGAKKEYGALKEKISTLESEIAKLDGSDTLIKGKLVAVTSTKVAPFIHYIEVQGRVESDQNVDITAQFPGTVEQVLVKEGQRVSKGQLLAQIDASALASQIQSLKTQLDFAKTMYEKQKRLREQNVGTEAQLLQAEAQYESLRSQVASMQSQYNNSRVTSPINGVIDAKFTKEGSMAAPGVPLFRIVGGSENKVVSNVAESYITQVRQGLKVKVYFPDLNKEIDGVIYNVSQSIDRVSRTFQVQVKIDSKDVRPNMISIVKIQDYQNSKSITAPVNAVQNSEEGNFVLIARKKGNGYVAVKQLVTNGVTYNGRTEVLQGLQEGDLIITTGYQDLVDDQPIRFKK